MLVSRGQMPQGNGQTVILQVNNPSKTFKTVLDLVAGNNVINHSLGLVAPFASEQKVLDNSTGAEISLRTVQETANSLTLYSVNPQKNVAISIVA